MNYLYFNICIRITIADSIQFNVCNSIQINKSVHNLTNTAVIQLPREYKNAVDEAGKPIDVHGKSILNFINKNDKIKIEFGYDNDFKTEFEGYITKIGADVPLVLECEDEMTQLKKAPRITKMIQSGKIMDVIKAVVPETYTVECDADYTMGKWLIKDATPYEVLEELKNKVGTIKAYFKDNKTLVVGSIIDFKPTTVHEFNFSENVRRGSDLKFNQLAETQRYITVESKQANGKTLSYSTGEKGENTETIKLTPSLTLDELKKYANMFLNTNKTNRLEGTLDSWCYPRTQPGDVAQIYRPYYADRHQDGKYFIEEVTIHVNSTDGIKRSNKLGYVLG